MLTKNEKITARNRANSQKSTGPKTEAGKTRSALNATTHGLAGQTVVLPREDMAAFQALRKRFYDELRPLGILEEQCVEMMANKSWLLARADALQTNLFAQGQIKHAHRTETNDPRVHTAMTAVHTYHEHVNDLEKLGRYQLRHHKMYRENLKQLRELQAERKALEASAKRMAANEILECDFESQPPTTPPPEHPSAPSSAPPALPQVEQTQPGEPGGLQQLAL